MEVDCSFTLHVKGKSPIPKHLIFVIKQFLEDTVLLLIPNLVNKEEKVKVTLEIKDNLDKEEEK